MRIFVAVDLSPDLRDAAAALVRDIRVRPVFSDASLRWTPVHQLHLTLHFLGDLTPSQVDRLVSVFSEPWPGRAFPIRLGGVGIFPVRGRPRVVTVGVTEGATQLEHLYAAAGRRVSALGLETDERAFRPHVTLGRFGRRSVVNGRRVRAEADLIEVALPVSPVDRVVVYESQLSREGATYRRVCEGMLGDA